MREAKEKGAHEREARKQLNIVEVIANLEDSKKAYKAKWTIAACKKVE